MMRLGIRGAHECSVGQGRRTGDLVSMTSSGMRAWSLCELAALTAPVVVVFGSSAPALLMRTR